MSYSFITARLELSASRAPHVSHGGRRGGARRPGPLLPAAIGALAPAGLLPASLLAGQQPGRRGRRGGQGQRRRQGKDSWVVAAAAATSAELALTASAAISSPVMRRRCISAGEHEVDLPRLELLSRDDRRDGDGSASTIPSASPLTASSRAIAAVAGGAYSRSSPFGSTTAAFCRGVILEFF
ncbi:hypothetical protein PAHAL_2G052900 [Panicum hallii]|uniref:Uncharacterized protein n=1 Tax=Panicum hallii TaxID=206008 RepID=A0A2T8KN59_9POAL|nr:hypothetical protein PAHAL_2G052900 [Panicum hallii]